MNIQKLEAASAQVCDLMTVLSNKTRLMILCQLVEGEKSVGELARLTGTRETVASQHLARLRRERIVMPRRDGQTIYYRLDREDVRALMTFLHDTYCGENSAAHDQRTNR